mgnify:FL=1
MSIPYFQDQQISFTGNSDKKLQKGEYENCTISNAELSSGDLSGYIFTDCLFEGSNLSLCTVKNTSFRNVVFHNCKLLGVVWENCNPFLLNFSFDHCIMNMGSFYGMKLKKIKFLTCSVMEVDFTETELISAVFDDCIFTKATFYKTNLQGADLTTSADYTIDPESNNVKNAKFRWPAAAGLLDKYNISLDQ